MGSPPAHRQLIHSLIKRRRASHRFQELIEHFQIFVLRLQLSVLFERRRGRGQIAELVINERQVEVNEREPGLDLRRSFIVKSCELQVSRVVIEVRQVVVRLDVPCALCR